MNYIGSKRSLIDFIQETILNEADIKEREDLVFADLFAGTGIVGATFRERNFKVIANDIQYYSYVLNKHLLQSDSEIEEDLLNYLNSLEGVEGFIYNNYCLGSGSGRNYFTDYNGKKCDAIRIELNNLKENKEINDKEYFNLLASLIKSIDKYANTASVYGAFLKKIKKSAAREFKLESIPIYKGKYSGEVYNKDINELILEVQGDVLYLDPPYNNRQYASNYHILETIARYDNPKISGKTGLRNYEDQKSDFCYKNKVIYAFKTLISNAKFNHIFLSYNNEGIMDLDVIKDIMSEHGEYNIFSKKYKRYKSDNNRNNKAEYTIEYLHYLKKGGNH